MELALDVNSVLGKLPKEFLSQIVRPVLTFDLGAFLKLADTGEIDRDLVRQYLEAKVTISVTPPKS